MKSSKLLAILLCFIFCNCKKDNPSASQQQDTNILTYSIQNTPAVVSIVASQHLINIRFPDGVMNADSIIANFTLSSGCTATIKNIQQVSGVSKNNYSSIITYSVSASGSSTDWKVISTNNNYTASQGFGNFLQQTVSNNTSFPWYIDQVNTGPFTINNSGPTVVTMLCKWADSTFTKTPQDARTAYRPLGGEWFSEDVTLYLRDNNIPNSTVALPATEDGTMQILKRQVDLNQLVIVDLEMNVVRFNSDTNSHVDRFYTIDPGIGHYIIVKGYKEVDNQMYFEVYDPNSLTVAYSNGNLKGKDRYYRSKDIFDATKTFWPKIFIAAKKGNIVIE